MPSLQCKKWLFVVVYTASIFVVNSQILSELSLQQLTPLSDKKLTWAIDIVRVLPTFQEIFNSTTDLVSDQCGRDLRLLFQALSDRELWALKMVDSSAKIPQSILNGAWIHLGNFDQCLEISPKIFPIQYCGPLISISEGQELSLSLQVASCLPAACSVDDVKNAVQSVFGFILPMASTQVTLTSSDCYNGQDKPPLDTGAWIMISVFVILGLLTALATLYDFLARKDRLKNRLDDVVMSFSMRKNFRSLISTRHAPGSVTCLHGLRLLSLFWIILCHRFAFNLSMPMLNPLDFLKSLSNVSYSLLVNSYVAVDTFFFISGFLVCHVFLAEHRRGKKFNILKYYLYRYIRLTTCLALLIGFYVTLLRNTGYGPRWRASTDWQMKHCDKYWWLNLLYLNNYVRLDHDSWDPLHSSADCVDQGWYLTVDMQLSWLAPLVLIPLVKWTRITSRVVMPLLILASCFTPFTSTYINEFPMTSDLRSTQEETRKFVTQMYWPTHMRATPYLVGIALAFFMDHVKDTKIKLSKWIVMVTWTCCTVICLVVVFATAIMYNPGHIYDKVEAAFYAGFHRLAWSIGLSWIVFACSRGYGGVINWILSWRALLPFSRLSYCMFITHFVVLYFDVGQMRTYVYYNSFSSTMDFFSDLWVTSVILGLPLHLCCEAPTLNLLRVFFPKGKTKKNKEETANAL